MREVIFFGASSLGQAAYYLLRNKFDILKYVDNDPVKWGEELEGIQIISPTELLEFTNTQIIITSSYVEEIAQQLQELGIRNYWIFNSIIEKQELRNSKLVNDNLLKINIGELLDSLDVDLSIKDVTFLSGGSSALDYFFLKALMIKLRLKVFLEIGTWTGESIAAVSGVADKCYSISLPDNNETLIQTFLKYCNKNNFSRYFSRRKKNIIHFEENSKTFDFEKNIDRKVDLVFIDGDHSYEGIQTDTQNIFRFLGYNDTIVVWHDFRTSRNELVKTTIDAILSVIPIEFQKNIYSVDNNYCGVYIPEKYKHYFSFIEDKNELYSYEISIKPKHNKKER